MHRPVATLILLALTVSCSSSSSGTVPPMAAGPAAGPVPTGSVTASALRSRLLQTSDLPDLSNRREFSSADLSTQAAPQLALCHDTQPVPVHELASVLAKPNQLGKAQVFQVLSAFPTASQAQQAYDQALRDARTCLRYTSAGAVFTVRDLGTVTVSGADAGFHYRLTTPSVVAGDVRTLVRAGKYLVLLTGYGRPPTGQTALGFQQSVMTSAVRRLVG